MASKSSRRSRESEASLVACMDQTHQLLAADLSIGQDMHGGVLGVGYHRLGGKDRP
jgi:hypothetical protein